MRKFKEELMRVFNRLLIISYVLSTSIHVFPQQVNQSAGLSLINSDYDSRIVKKDEQILQKFFYGFHIEKLNIRYNIKNNTPLNCLTSTINEFDLGKNIFHESKQNELNSYLSPSSTNSKTYTSSSSMFEICYDTSGINSVPLYDNDSSNVPDYIESIAGYLDYSLSVMIENLGFLSPVKEGEKYKIEFQNMFAAGYTIKDPENINTTKIVLNNNLIEFEKKYGNNIDTMGTAKSTIAHELKHAIQFAYTKWNEKSWFLELDATWMEEIIFNNVNGYYKYLNTSQITDPGSSLANGMGYGNCIWMHYLTQSFGVEINREIWELASSNNDNNFSDNSLNDIIEEVLLKTGNSLNNAVTEYFVWNYFSGNYGNFRFNGYKESSNYPSPKICAEINALPFSGNGGKREQFSASFIEIKSTKENSLFQVQLDFIDSKNIVVLIQKLVNGELSIQYLEQENSSISYISDNLLLDVEEIVLIPVALSSNSGNYDYTYQINRVPSDSDIVDPTIILQNLDTQIDISDFPYKVVAEIWDEYGIDTAYIEYSFGDGISKTTELVKLENDLYCGHINYDSSSHQNIDELRYRVVAVDSNDLSNIGFFPANNFLSIQIMNSKITDIEETESNIDEYVLFENYPNPFNPTTQIRFGLPEKSEIQLSVYNILGQEVAQLTNSIEEKGIHEVKFDASTLSSGTYIYLLIAKSINGNRKFTKLGKMLLVK
jgi:Secretion system C-terminal sorting domain/Family of unknown function (DUF6055)